MNLLVRCTVAAVAALPALVLGAATPAWVEKSNANAQLLLSAIGDQRPEVASSEGLTQYDTRVSDVGPGADERLRASLSSVGAELQRRLATESDPLVRQDLQIMIQAAQLQVEDLELEKKYFIPFIPAAQQVYQGLFTLLNPESTPDRHAAAVTRLRRYAGLMPGSKPLTEEAKARTEAALKSHDLRGPYRGEVEQELENTTRYIAGIRRLFTINHLTDVDDALAAIEAQLTAYDAWARRVVLPRCRSDFRLPEEVYTHNLRQLGVDISPDALIAKAELEFSEVTAAMQSLALQVAAQHGWPDTDYRAVIRRLKQDQLKRDAVEPYYRDVVIPSMEKLIREHHIVTLPDRPMVMRIASDAEGAVQPAPHMQPPRLIDNHGERGTFVLPLGNPPAKDNAADVYDDFTFPATAWTMVAHEGRPGHELQFARMVEAGVSHARAIFAFNSVNAEGWALYAETEMQPYEPLDAQLIVLQFRLLRAVRAIADPMLNLGRMTRDRAHDLLVNDVGISEAFAHEELDRFMFRMQGQATSYFYGFTRLMELKAETKVALGGKFDNQAFNDFIVNQGLLPPALMDEAVRTEFIPSRMGSPAR